MLITTRKENNFIQQH